MPTLPVTELQPLQKPSVQGEPDLCPIPMDRIKKSILYLGFLSTSGLALLAFIHYTHPNLMATFFNSGQLSFQKPLLPSLFIAGLAGGAFSFLTCIQIIRSASQEFGFRDQAKDTLQSIGMALAAPILLPTLGLCALLSNESVGSKLWPERNQRQTYTYQRTPQGPQIDNVSPYSQSKTSNNTPITLHDVDTRDNKNSFAQQQQILAINSNNSHLRVPTAHFPNASTSPEKH